MTIGNRVWTRRCKSGGALRSGRAAPSAAAPARGWKGPVARALSFGPVTHLARGLRRCDPCGLRALAQIPPDPVQNRTHRDAGISPAVGIARGRGQRAQVWISQIRGMDQRSANTGPADEVQGLAACDLRAPAGEKTSLFAPDDTRMDGGQVDVRHLRQPRTVGHHPGKTRQRGKGCFIGDRRVGLGGKEPAAASVDMLERRVRARATIPSSQRASAPAMSPSKCAESWIAASARVGAGHSSRARPCRR